MRWAKLAILLLVFGLFIQFAPKTSAATILKDYSYAWSDNVGYINLSGVTVEDGFLSGYAWSSNSGWIKFSPTNGGVKHDGKGKLSGSAWGEQLGWISFDGVVINTTTGRFSGTATGTLVGTLTFDCPIYCDVRTDWRLLDAPVSTKPNPVVTTIGTFPSASPNHIDTFDKDLTILPHQSGTYTFTAPAGVVVVNVPANNISAKTTFFVVLEPLDDSNNKLVNDGVDLADAAFYNVFAKDENDYFVRAFNAPITITLPIQQQLKGHGNLAVYWFDETNQQWVLIPDAIFSENSATFQVNHLTKFAIFADNSASGSKPSPTLPILTNDVAIESNQNSKYLIWLWIVLLFVSGWLVLRKKRDKKDK